MSMFVYILMGLYWVFYIYRFFMIASVIFSWIPGVYNYKIPMIIGTIGDWYLKPFLGKIIIGAIDFTPVIGFVIYSFALDALDGVLIDVLNMFFGG